ncbi:DUF4113 domain-containing protein [Modicisalibacter sp. MOD 31.J]|uniref:DUF4113 domain-containing protein n=1 Tax=Modicisalibacter sp. MOD 31.J TaxID=2831897 RepID=UPI001CCF30BC|nr:DUF4113 domain-containing protein [Modicisalibacter sp. MOD 31.J]
MLTDMSPRTHEQQDLLADQQSDADRERSERLMATLDKLNNEHGAGTVRLGLGRADAAWHMRSANRTPRYTAKWDELPIVRMG